MGFVMFCFFSLLVDESVYSLDAVDDAAVNAAVDAVGDAVDNAVDKGC